MARAADSAPPSVTGLSPPAGPFFGGTEAILTGSGFTGATAVRFGLVPAELFEVESDTRIIATTPAQLAGTVVHVQVTTGAGTSATSAEDTFAYARGNWVPAGTMALSSRGPAALLSSGRVLVAVCTSVEDAGGDQPGDRDCAVKWEREGMGGGRGGVDGAALYDPARGEDGWSLTDYVPTRVHWPTATAMPPSGVLLAGSARVDGSSPLAFLYEAGRNAWSDVTGAMASGRREHAAVLLPGDKVLVTGGTSTTTYFDGATTAGSTTYTSAEPHFTIADQGRGITGAGLADATTVAAFVDPSTVTLSAPATATVSNQEFTLSAVTSERYDPAGGATGEGTWSPAGFMTTPRRGHTATLLETGEVLVTGGYRDRNYEDPLASAEIYDPQSGTWRRTGSMAHARRGHTATLLANGDVLVVGGGGGASAEVYHPADGTWRPTGSLHTARAAGHTATALKDGTVLVAGGSSGAGATAISELYDPLASAVVDGRRVDGGWRLTTSLRTARTGHTATALLDGRVLVAGGVGPGIHPTTGQPVASVGATAAEIFDPAPSARPASTVVAVDPPSGPPSGGTKVTITGRSLSPAPTVRFGDVPATAVTVLSDTRITAVAPPQARGDVEVTVTTSTGTSARGPLFSYGAGVWKGAQPLTSCAPEGSPSCVAREAQASVLLEGLPCRAGSPPAWCGKVLVMGGGAAFTDGNVVVTDNPETSKILHSESADFTAADVGRPIVGLLIAPGTTIARFVSESEIELSAAVVGTFTPSTTVSSHFTHHVGTTQLYDPRTGAWVPTGSMAFERSFNPLRPRNELPTVPFTATLLPTGKVLVTGGCCPGPHNLYTNPGLDSAEVYDPEDGTWRSTTPMGSGDQPHLPAPPCPDGYDPPPGGVTCAGPGRMNHTATLLDGPACLEPAPPAWCGRVLVLGGISDHYVKATAELYDPDDDTWTWVGGPMSYARAGHTASLLPDGTVLVAGGVGCWTKDPETGQNCTEPVIPNLATSAGDQVSDDLASAERFDPARMAWVDAPDMATKRTAHTATVVQTGTCGATCTRLMVAGGRETFTQTLSGDPDEPLTTRSTQIYDPVGGTWTSTRPMYHSRFAHTATLLSDGRVLVTGGWGGASEGEVGTEGEIYDPIGADWEITTPVAGAGAAAGLSDPRRSHTATLLDPSGCDGRFWPGYPCGKVLVAGGSTLPGSHIRPNASEVRSAFASAALYTAGPHITAVVPSEGRSAGGDQVIITGANFESGSTVSFGGTPAPEVTAVSPTEAVTRAPVHVSGMVTLSVETAEGGSSATLNAQPRATFRYVVSEAPAAVADLAAEAVSGSEVALSFSAAASDGGRPPPAWRYVVKQASSPIVDDAGFAAAATLCGGECTYVPAAVGDRLTLSVGGLEPATTYHFALAAVNAVGLVGLRSNPATATTTGQPGRISCTTPPPGPGQVAFAGGYSLVGLPGGTRRGSASTLYGWFDQGSGGRYSTFSSSEPLTAGRGYWAWSACPYLAQPTNPGQPNATMALGAYRASMVANPWASGPVTVSGFDYAARWDQRLNGGSGGYHLSGFRQPQTLAVGEGIWVFSYTATTIKMAP